MQLAQAPPRIDLERTLGAIVTDTRRSTALRLRCRRVRLVLLHRARRRRCARGCRKQQAAEAQQQREQRPNASEELHVAAKGMRSDAPAVKPYLEIRQLDPTMRHSRE